MRVYVLNVRWEEETDKQRKGMSVRQTFIYSQPLDDFHEKKSL